MDTPIPASPPQGCPLTREATASSGDPGILRTDFPGYSGEESLTEISWDDWFRKFDDKDLVLLYQETTEGGEKSNFNKILDHDTAHDAVQNAKWVL